MAEEILVIPPIRQSLEDITSAKANEIDQPLTEKSWYLYWQRCGDQINVNTDKLGKMITFGTHAGRPPGDQMPNGALYCEGDRGGVIYQNVNGVWKYRAGTMFGTLSPDQRPTDLGVNDGGFDFRGTDAARQFLWSQTEWIETTEAQYGNHSARPNPATIVQGALYCESDRGGVLYQNIGSAWKYRAGTMYGTLTPDLRPTDLGVNDGGFEFRGTDEQRHFIWSQSAWIEVDIQTGESNSIQINYASGGLTLTTSWQMVPGTVVNLSRVGQYLIQGTFFFNCQSGDTGTYLLGRLSGAGPNAVLFAPPIPAGQALQVTVSQQWIFGVSAPNTTVWLEGTKQSGTGASSIGASHTSISALWVSP